MKSSRTEELSFSPRTFLGLPSARLLITEIRIGVQVVYLGGCPRKPQRKRGDRKGGVMKGKLSHEAPLEGHCNSLPKSGRLHLGPILITSQLGSPQRHRDSCTTRSLSYPPEAAPTHTITEQAGDTGRGPRNRPVSDPGTSC